MCVCIYRSRRQGDNDKCDFLEHKGLTPPLHPSFEQVLEVPTQPGLFDPKRVLVAVFSAIIIIHVVNSAPCYLMTPVPTPLSTNPT